MYTIALLEVLWRFTWQCVVFSEEGEASRSGSSCDPFNVVVISCPVNKKTTATNGGSFAGIKSYQLFFPKVTGFSGAQSPKLSFQCSRSQASTSRTLVKSVRQHCSANQLPMATANGDLSCLSGLESREQLPEQAW